MNKKKNLIHFGEIIKASTENISIDCLVSGRYLKLGEEYTVIGDRQYLVIDVMTTNTDWENKKLCELIVDRKELLSILSNMKPRKDKKE